jgi:predicted ATP-grasp superfamily ATP-dependent carboligase
LKILAVEKKLSGWVVFPTDDETVYVLSRHKKDLEKYYRITTPAWDVTRYAYNKKLTYKLALDLGLAIPRTLFPQTLKDLNRLDLEFPIVIKPAIVKKFYNVTKRKVFVAHNRHELKHLFKKTNQIIPSSEIMLQEYIPGGTEHQYSFCPMFKDGKVIARVIARRSRQHPMDFGHASTFVETINIPLLEEIGTKFLRAIDYYGIAEVEFKKDPRDGKYKLLEVNPRIWGWHSITRKACLSLTYALFQDISGRKILANDFKEGVKWMRLSTDMPTALGEILRKKMCLSGYLRSFRGDKEFAVLNPADPLPIIMEFLLLLYFWTKKGF